MAGRPRPRWHGPHDFDGIENGVWVYERPCEEPWRGTGLIGMASYWGQRRNVWQATLHLQRGGTLYLGKHRNEWAARAAVERAYRAGYCRLPSSRSGSHLDPHTLTLTRAS